MEGFLICLVAVLQPYSKRSVHLEILHLSFKPEEPHALHLQWCWDYTLEDKYLYICETFYQKN